MMLISLFRKNVYDRRLGINLLLIGKDGMGVVSIRPGSGLVGLLRLPDNLSIPVEVNGAEYVVESFYKVGLPVDDALNAARVGTGQALGVVLSGVVKAPVEFGLAGLREALFTVSTQSNLSLVDRYFLVKDITEKLGSKTSLAMTLPKNVIDTAEEPDGKKVGKLNTAVFVWSRNQWVVDEVLSETAEVTVVNASGKDGKARLVAHQIESAGVRVIDLLAAKKDFDQSCVIWGNTKVHPKTAEFLASSFSCQPVEKLNLLDYIDRDVKSDLVVVLGKRS